METTADYVLEEIPIWDFTTFYGLEEFKSLMEEVTLVVAHDRTTGQSMVVYGAEVLRAMRNRVIPRQRFVTVRLAVDCYSRTEVERLCQWLQAAKGFDEWPG